MNLRSRTTILLSLLLALAVAVTLAFAFVLTEPESRGDIFWVSIGLFVWCEFLTFGLAIYYNAVRGEAQHPAPMFFAMGVVVLAYDAAVIAGAIILWAVLGVELKTYLLTHLFLLFALVLCGAGVGILAGNVTKEERREKAGRAHWQDMQIAVDDIIHRLNARSAVSPNHDIVKALRALSEAIRFADPIGDPELCDPERAIEEQIRDLRAETESSSALNGEQAATLVNRVRDIERAVEIRNTRLKTKK